MKLGKLTIKRGSDYYTDPGMWTIGWGIVHRHGYFWPCLWLVIKDEIFQ